MANLPRADAHNLSQNNHDRDAAGFTYVYPVISRRSGGVSVGINLNPNNACNWRCVYCQVPDLTLGKGPAIDLDQLERELTALLTDLTQGDFMERRVPPEARVLQDVAFSGNGEPTTSPNFAEALERVGRVLKKFELLGKLPVVLITNGSMLGREAVLSALAALKAMNGRVWFKLDSATKEGHLRINSQAGNIELHLERLAQASRRCPTWVQTCLFARGGEPPSPQEQAAYLDALERTVAGGAPLSGVLLYGLARPSQQREAPELSALSHDWLESFAEQLRERTELEVQVHG